MELVKSLCSQSEQIRLEKLDQEGKHDISKPWRGESFGKEPTVTGEHSEITLPCQPLSYLLNYHNNTNYGPLRLKSYFKALLISWRIHLTIKISNVFQIRLQRMLWDKSICKKQSLHSERVWTRIGPKSTCAALYQGRSTMFMGIAKLCADIDSQPPGKPSTAQPSPVAGWTIDRPSLWCRLSSLSWIWAIPSEPLLFESAMAAGGASGLSRECNASPEITICQERQQNALKR